MSVSERFLLLPIRNITKTFTTALIHVQRLTIASIASGVLPLANSQVGESNDDRGTEAAQHSNDASGVCRGLIRAEGLRTNQVAGRVTNVDDSKDDSLLSSAAGVGLGEGDEDDIWCFVWSAL
jgi:hypothetical protein